MRELINLNSFEIQTVLKTLLIDKSTKKNIIWATNSYKEYGEEYCEISQITIDLLNKLDLVEIQPRVLKTIEAQKNRTKNKAEVFTPSWICNQMNNYLDDEWFERKNVFNKENENHSWKAKPGRIGFYNEKKKTWKDYVYLRKIEITCGEAPYLVSRYDTTTGQPIRVSQRIGALDRKLRVVNENAETEAEWFEWVVKAYQSTYGFEYQGDNLLIARINLLLTFIDNLKHKWKRKPTDKELKKIANIIVWNIWQMDGLKNEIPFENKTEIKIKNWRNGTGTLITYKNIGKEKKGMTFDFAIFNPPYQEERENTSDKPIYPLFLDFAYEIANVVETITPARFLFNAGRTPKEWNKKMLNDEHLKVIDYVQDSSKVFSNTDIKGGVAIILRKKNEKFGAIKQFSQFKELNSIAMKVKSHKDFVGLNTIMYPYSTYSLSDDLFKDYPDIRIVDKNDKNDKVGFHVLSNNKILTTNIFDLLPDIFLDSKPNDDNNYICILGRQNNERIKKYINDKYVNVAENYKKWKIIIPKSNGSGAIGETLSTPLVGTPLVGYSQSFLGIGSLNTEYEANALMKYILCKFSRTTLGILKITQDNPPEKWLYVPLQNFAENSDIDWSKSIKEIDQQLYKKYGLSEDEINFIEEKVKEME